jgi:Type II secretion system (T2SS), protein F
MNFKSITKLLWGRFPNRAMFYRSLADAYDRKEALKDYFRGEIKNAKRVKDNRREGILSSMLAQASDDGNGAGLLAILMAHMPKSDHLMLQPLGDVQPTAIPAVLRTVSEVVGLQAEIKEIIFAGFITPIMLTLAALLSISVDSDLITSTARATPAYVFGDIFSGGNYLVLQVAQLARQVGLFVIAAFVVLLCLVFWMLPWRSKGLRRKLDSWPLFSTYRDIQSSKILPTLAVFLKAGIQLPNAVEKVGRGASPWARSQLRRASAALAQPGTPSVEAFGQGLVGKLLLADILTLARSQPLSEVVVDLSTAQGKKMTARVKSSVNFSGYFLSGTFMCVALYLFFSGFGVQAAFSREMSDPYSLAAKERAWREKSIRQPVINPVK